MQLLGAVIGVAVLAASVVVGAFMLAGLLGFMLIVAVVFYLRLWWLRRKMRAHPDFRDEDIIVTEYRVVESHRRDSAGSTKNR